MALIYRRRPHEECRDSHDWIFIDQFGDCVSLWIGSLHIQLYRAWTWPTVEWWDGSEEPAAVSSP